MADEQKSGIDQPRPNGENAAERQPPSGDVAEGVAGPTGAANAGGAGNPKAGAGGQSSDASGQGPTARDQGLPTGAQASTAGGGGARTAGRMNQGEGEGRRAVDELADAYEKAREELNQAMGTLRTELGKVDLHRARQRARSWFDENPTLTLFIGIGAGIVAGRIMSKAFRKPPVTVRAKRQAEALTGQFSDIAEEIGEAVAHAVTRATRTVAEVGARGKEPAAKVARRAMELGEDVADSAGRTIGFLGDAAEDAGTVIRKKSARAGKKAKKKISHGIDLSDAAVNALRTAVAAVVVKKVAKWVKNMR